MRVLELNWIKSPQIFDKFWQSDAVASGQAASTGLGLTFCKLAVEAHEGTIEVASQLNEGTTFVIKFPTNDLQRHSPGLDQSDDVELILVHEKIPNQCLCN